MSLYLPIQQPKTQKENIVSNSKCISLYSNLYYTYKLYQQIGILPNMSLRVFLYM